MSDSTVADDAIPFFCSSVNYINWNQEPTKLESIESFIHSLLFNISVNANLYQSLSLKKSLVTKQLIQSDDKFIMSDLFCSHDIIKRSYLEVSSFNLNQRLQRINGKLEALERTMQNDYKELECQMRCKDRMTRGMI